MRYIKKSETEPRDLREYKKNCRKASPPLKITYKDRVLQLVLTRENLALYLPESFEWLVLSSGILKDTEVAQILQTPSDYIDSKEYFSWERYFTALLIEKSAGTYLNYTKKTLNKAYLSDSTKNAILGQMMKGKPE